MKIITPIDINDTNMDSSISEPDALTGEYEFEFRSTPITTAHTLYRFDFGGGFVWGITQLGGTLYKYTERFVFVESFDISATTPDTIGIAFVQGNLYITNVNDGNVYIFNQLGALISSFSIASELTTPSVIMWDGSFVHVFDLQSTSIYKYSGITYESSWSTPLTISGACSDGVNIYLNNNLTDQLLTLDIVNYSTISTFATVATANTGCAINGGRLFMANSVQNRVYEYSKDGLLGSGYIVGERVIKSSTHKVYESVSFNNEDPIAHIDSSVNSNWVEVSATNKYAMFDYKINTKSTLPVAGSFIEFTPLEPVTNIALFGMENITRVLIVVRTDNAFGSVIYSNFQDTQIASPIEDTIVNDVFLGDKLLFDDLPTYATPFIAVTFISSEANISIGDIAIGNARSLGVVNYQSSTSRTSYDTVKKDAFGNNTVISRPSAEYTSFEISVTPTYADYVERILKDSLNQARVWVGEKPNDENIFTFGYYERSPIIYSSPTKYGTNLKIRGLV